MDTSFRSTVFRLSGKSSGLRSGALSRSLLSVSLFIYPVIADNFSGQVVRILDGDTIKVLQNQHPERIRLSGIDCPEKGQAYDQRAKQATSELVFGKDVTLQTYGKEKYKRTIADVLLLGGTNVNHAWWQRAGAGGIESMRLEIRR